MAVVNVAVPLDTLFPLAVSELIVPCAATIQKER